MATRNKFDLVLHILARDEGIRDWYSMEHNIKAGDLTVQSVRTYGIAGHGEVADLIIQDGRENGIITAEQAENESL